ncbi:AraC family transcriptional regulator, regulatory protein of adaptative response / methylated-DNA-[protein]-cysteine methyltransferase [Desulfacinum infernum DSM 9756]|uniref:AraC family transcriptional regulator, regulatory protein of adaptative response / methylated-DNA-[protein]-cysteine methyltransferase n=2 Tax=Desulfacinum infernum TaxID=35837 RepID=A0A1M5A4G3_9BACT|nr:AraC family transcriptional regulator, regulatory protein of adaptative response / methylated-DNA-[protein]-cysteine methyltransferase [Desulfacinum infernum DSM 9756]
MKGFVSEEARWRAVLDRDGAADGIFVYAVVTTGVYCRPSCPSRRPRRENVRFFESYQEAEKAGFRACAKCRPNRSGAHPGAELVEWACRRIAQAESPPKLKDLAEEAGCSPSHLQRIFKKILAITPSRYAAQLRRQKVQTHLGRGASVTEAIHEAGYGSGSRFYERDGKELGMSPKQYARGGKGMEIRFASAPCSLGWVLVAATDRGVCAVFLGDSPEALERELRERFPRARTLPEDPHRAVFIEKVLAHLEAPHRTPADLPLDVRGTAFQQRVWEALRRIPPGETATYSEIARRIGSPSAVRAVARACASNPAALVIPCHRVVRSDGTLAGYRWGLERKRRLLEREGLED